jgi:hypothetical protein
MGLFHFSSRGNQNGQHQPVNPAQTIQPEVPPMETFIESNGTNGKSENGQTTLSLKNIDLLYQFLDQDFAGTGYNDTLTNPDTHHLEQNIQLIFIELQRTVNKVTTFYEDFIQEIDFHIESRSRSGMVDTVEELKMKKTIAQSHISKIAQIEDDLHNNKGTALGVTMSYTKGFKNGLAAISHHTMLKKQL